MPRLLHHISVRYLSVRDGSMMGPAIPVFRYGYGSFYISSEHEGPETRLAEGRRQPAGEGS